MKKLLLHIFLLAFALILFPGSLFAQQPERCASVHYNKMLEQNNPALAEERRIGDELVARLVSERNFKSTRSVITIPVVVHVVYRTNLENIPDSQIHSQIDVLNEDFGRTNADAALTPSAFAPVASNTGIQFCLATRKPNGDWTNGIERRQTTVIEWLPDDYMKYYSQGGLDIWDPTSYLNLWVCNLGSNFLGYSTDPIPVDLLRDGVVIRYRSFGRVGYLTAPYDKGRTATHEVGHWLNLRHIWGDDGGTCINPDNIYDTPNQADFTLGCPVFPVYDACSYPGCEATQDTSNPCSSFGIMFMNYMDYTDDACMNIFTQEQASYMQTAIDTFRSTLYNSSGCSPAIGIGEISEGQRISIYPNPAGNEIRIACSGNADEKFSLSVYDVTGKEILSQEKFTCADNIPVNISSLVRGVYFLKLKGARLSAASRFVVIR
ncbi:MAG TPA: T9SS type A sorting domain-containing protein [Bacteroidia bacterium]|nr:T9SS type A sorting domain-containing protein [Bacteroidia bacterium]